jgi:hypothetical protein
LHRALDEKSENRDKFGRRTWEVDIGINLKEI